MAPASYLWGWFVVLLLGALLAVDRGSRVGFGVLLWLAAVVLWRLWWRRSA